MSDQPLIPGQPSPDGKWRWDGKQWVPAAGTPPQVVQRSSGTWVWWLAGGCALIIVLVVAVVIAGAAFGGIALYHRFQTGGFSCLPSDFPVYPGASYGGESYSLNAPTPGNYCRMVFESNDTSGRVDDFYASRLNAGDWKVVSRDTTASLISFSNTKRAGTKGTVLIAASNGRSEITVQLYSP